MLHAALVAFAAYVFVGNLPVQAKPDFTGNWSVVSGLESWGVERLVVTHTSSAVTVQVTKGTGVSLDSRTYRLDGIESRAESKDSDGRTVLHTSRVEWIGAAIAITTTTVTSNGGRYQEFDAYSFDRGGHLVVLRIWTGKTAPFMGTSRVAYKRD